MINALAVEDNEASPGQIVAGRHHDPRPFETLIASHRAGRSQATARESLAAWSRVFDQPDPALFPWHLLRYEHAAHAWEQIRQASRAPATANLRLSLLRSVVRECEAFGLMLPAVAARIRLLKRAKGERLPRGRHVLVGEVKAVLERASARDRALLTTLYGCGLRRAEAAAMTLAALRPDGTLRILGKGDKERSVPIPGGTMRALVRWIELRGTEEGPMFVRVDKRGQPVRPLRPLKPKSVSVQVKKVAARADVALSAHDFRRSFAGEMIDATDILTVRKLLGHASVSTTQIYDRRPERAAFEAIARFHVPFVPEKP